MPSLWVGLYRIAEEKITRRIIKIDAGMLLNIPLRVINLNNQDLESGTFMPLSPVRG
jgi:hypothetical protein